MDREQAIKLMQDLLRRMVERNGSDLFITAGFAPRSRSTARSAADRPAALARAGRAAGARDHERRQTKEFDSTKECNFAIAPPGIGRFRVSAFVQHGPHGCGAAHDQLQDADVEELELPPILKEIVLSKRGLCIIVGATGSGKSTTLAAMVDYRNEKTRGHIVTIEDPIEYVHRASDCRDHAA
jgi:twitching motility protein PilU